MAGYIFNLDSLDSLKLYVENGVYTTKLKNQPNRRWKSYQEATFADYVTMKEGDNIYFFIERKIYGIGKLVTIQNDCKFSNFPNACEPKHFNYSEINNSLLWDEGEISVKQRWVCTFEPAPRFFTQGIDMDDVLSSNPSAFKMLRAFWKVSFIKFDDVENQAMKDIILKFNQDALTNRQEDINIFRDHHEQIHDNIKQKIIQLNRYELDIVPFLNSCVSVNNPNKLEHEMAIEAGILYQLSYRDEDTLRIFDEWDYLSHQVIASPFKPIDYMDRMDVFGYSFLTGYSPTRSKYLVIEIKKDSASKDDVDQLMKYVDWIKDEYCSNDYSMINAFLVANVISDDVLQYKNQTAMRNYIIGRRPARSLVWNNLKLVKYSYNPDLKKLVFNILG